MNSTNKLVFKKSIGCHILLSAAVDLQYIIKDYHNQIKVSVLLVFKWEYHKENPNKTAMNHLRIGFISIVGIGYYIAFLSTPLRSSSILKNLYKL